MRNRWSCYFLIYRIVYTVEIRYPSDMFKCSYSPCGLRLALTILGDRWSILLLRDLLEGPHRFTALQRSLTGISPRTLTQRLRSLEAEGLVRKQVFAEALKAEYCLTERGSSLHEIINQLRDWGEQVERERSDGQVAPETLRYT